MIAKARDSWCYLAIPCHQNHVGVSKWFLAVWVTSYLSLTEVFYTESKAHASV